ncbi:unnamed protein product [Amoebophrya sp. A25]|nr:unnamed protein product [Amoebophrya sp. A25]|eukprot:GSA25T00016825001.1
MRRWNVATPATTRSAAIVASASKGVRRVGSASNVDSALGRVWARRIAPVVAVGGSWRLCAALGEKLKPTKQQTFYLASLNLKHLGEAGSRDSGPRCQYLTAAAQGQEVQFSDDRGLLLAENAKPSRNLLQAVDFDDNDHRAYDIINNSESMSKSLLDEKGEPVVVDSAFVPARGTKTGITETKEVAVTIVHNPFRLRFPDGTSRPGPSDVIDILNGKASMGTTDTHIHLRQVLQNACVSLDVAGSPCCVETYFAWARWHFEDEPADEAAKAGELVGARAFAVLSILLVQNRLTGTLANYMAGEPPFNTWRPRFESSIRLRAGELFAVRVQQLHEAGYAHLNLSPVVILFAGDPSRDAWWDVKLFNFASTLPANMLLRAAPSFRSPFLVGGPAGFRDPRISLKAVPAVPWAEASSMGAFWLPGLEAPGGTMQARLSDMFMVGTVRVMLLRGEVYIVSCYVKTIDQLIQLVRSRIGDDGDREKEEDASQKMWRDVQIDQDISCPADPRIRNTSPLYDLDQYKLRTGKHLLRWEPVQRNLKLLVIQDKLAALIRLLVGETLTQGQVQAWKEIGLEQDRLTFIRAQQEEMVAVDTSTLSVSAFFDRVQQVAKQVRPNKWGLLFVDQIPKVDSVHDGDSTWLSFPSGLVVQEGTTDSARHALFLRHIELLPPAPATASATELQGFVAQLTEVMKNPSDAAALMRMEIPEPAKNPLQAALQDAHTFLRGSRRDNTRGVWLKVSDVVGAHLLLVLVGEVDELSALKGNALGAFIESNPKGEGGGPHVSSASHAPSLLDVSLLGDVIPVHDNSFLETSLTDVVEDPFDEVDQPHAQEPSRLSQSVPSFLVSSSSSKGPRTDPSASSSSSSTAGEDATSSVTSSDDRARSSTASTLRVVSKHVHDDDGGEEEDTAYLSP